MFNFFKRNKSKKNTLPELLDLQGQEVVAGDKVNAFRYELGVCKVIVVEGKYLYESESTGEQVSWLRMIDASTDRQKVEKIV